MSKALYLNRDKPPGAENRRFTRWLAAAAVIILLLAVGALAILARQNKAADTVLDRFEAALEEGDYPAVLALHAEARRKSLSSYQSETNRAIYEDAAEEMEKTLQNKIKAITDKLYASARPRLSSAELEYLAGMQELAAAPLLEETERTALGLLGGEVTLDQAEAILEAYSEIPAAADRAEEIRAELPALDSAKEPYMAAMNALSEDNYLLAASSLDSILDSGIIQPDGETADLIEAQLKSIREEMRPIMVGDIKRLVSMNKYVTADKQIRSLLAHFPDDNEVLQLYEDIRDNVPKNLVPYTGIIEHITTRPLIANSSAGLGAGPIAQTADSTMLTPYEFSRILEELYTAGYILVDIHAMMNDAGEMNPLMLPEGKRPLMLTLEGLNYYPVRRLSGNPQNLIIDDQGQVAAQFYDDSGLLAVSRTAESVGIVDQFLEEHPDFSFDGAKGTITLTGSMGIFGYVTNEDQLLARNEQALQYGLPPETYTAEQLASQKSGAEQVIQALLDTGWTFGSQTYHGMEVTGLTLEQIRTDTEAWFRDVGSMVGKVSTIAYPNGAILSGTDERKLYLQDQGFRYFLGMGPNPYAVGTTGYYFMDRLYIGGFALRNNLAGRLFSAAAVYDPARPIPLS